MERIGTSWAGNIYGTNAGKFFLKFDRTENPLSGMLRIRDLDLGVATYRIEGSVADTISLIGTPSEPENELAGRLNIKATLTAEGNLRGEWISEVGTGGIFIAFPHADQVSSSNPQIVPEQIYSRVSAVGSISLYKEDLLALIEEVRKDFATTTKVVTTYSTGQGEVTKYADDFVKELDRLTSLTYLKVQVQEPEAHGINRAVAVELRAHGENEVKVQGIGESWVIGRAEALTSFIRRYENSVITSYKKFGLNINSFIFMGMLIAIPEITSLIKRAAFVIAIVILLFTLLNLHSKLIPNATLRPSTPGPGQLQRLIPTLGSWTFAIITSVIASYIYTWLQ